MNSSSESLDEDEEWETISYEMVCQVLNHHLSSTKLPYNIKLEVQTNIMDVEMANNSIGYMQSLISSRHSLMKSSSSTLFLLAKWLRVRREILSCLWCMSMWLVVINQG